MSRQHRIGSWYFWNRIFRILTGKILKKKVLNFDIIVSILLRKLTKQVEVVAMSFLGREAQLTVGNEGLQLEYRRQRSSE